MDLTLIIKRSKSEKANPNKTIESLNHSEVILKDIIYIDNLSDIDYGIFKTDWWLILYDDEVVEYRLVDVFPFIQDQWMFDCFSLYRHDLEGKITFCPRLFRKEVKTRTDYLYPREKVCMEVKTPTDYSYPVKEVRMEKLLDGWICEQGYPL